MKSNLLPSTRIFKDIFSTIQDDQFKSIHRKRKESFTRQRVLGFSDLIMLQIKRIVLSLSVEVEKFLDIISCHLSYSKQAFSKARQYLSYSAFMALNTRYVGHYYQYTDFLEQFEDKYVLIAVDGSLMQLPESEQLAEHFGRWKNQTDKGMVMGRASLIYDVLNRVVLSAELSPCTIGERALFEEQYDQVRSKEMLKGLTGLFLMDRGYPSFELCKGIDLRGDAFVIRCKAGFNKEVKKFVKEDIEEKWVSFPACSWESDGRPKKSKYKEELKVRIVRILLPDKTYEYLLTNTHFDIATLSKLYQLRWGVETHYGFLKEKMQIENFSSKKTEGVLQDFHATILTSNLSQLLIQEAEQELAHEKSQEKQNRKPNKYSYQINQNVALGILRDQIPKLFADSENLEEKLAQLRKRIKRHKVAIVPKRSFPRMKLKRNRRKFHFSKKRPF